MPESAGCSVLRKSQSCCFAFCLGDDAIADIGAVEAGDEGARLVQTQALHDLPSRGAVRGGGEREARECAGNAREAR